MIGRAPAFLDALARASALADVDRPVLVLGERGAGKELFAQRLHFLSPRWEGPLVTVNCAAMSETLLESELFGHEAGAFTGAVKRREGRFERAEGGTLFLDEISSASLAVQEKLLRVVEYGEYERVGGDKPVRADARIVAAANIDLRAAAARGAFRADLLDRLAFDVLAAPPLREREDDVPLLAAHFAARMGAELGEAFPGFAPAAVATLCGYDWPGNVRELKNVAERAMFAWSRERQSPQIERVVLNPFPELRPLAASEPESDAPPPPARLARPSAPVTDLRAAVDDIERDLVRDALLAEDGHQGRAAKALSLSYDQLRGLVKKHAIDVKALKARQTAPG